jgi:VanZ family protein
MILVAIQSSIRTINLPDLAWKFTDKAVHFFVFGLLGWLMTRGFAIAKTSWLQKHPVKFALLIGCVFAVSDELHQYYVPGREAELFDLVIDCSGIFLFALYYRWQNPEITAPGSTESH